MSVMPRCINAQFYRLMLYGRPLHPELFHLQARRMERHGSYETEMWLIPGGHVVRFQVADQVRTEVVIDRGDHLPETGLLHALPCLGEKDFEIEKPMCVGYVTSIQTETLANNLYRSTYDEMVDFAAETGALSFASEAPDGSKLLSVLDTQKYRRDYHVQSYHLLGSSGVVLRTQTIFENLL